MENFNEDTLAAVLVSVQDQINNTKRHNTIIEARLKALEAHISPLGEAIFKLEKALYNHLDPAVKIDEILNRDNRGVREGDKTSGETTQKVT